MKECIKCNQIKDLLNFNNDKRKKDGLSKTCKECYNEYRQIIRKKYVEEKFTPPSEEFLNSNYRTCNVCNEQKILASFSKDKRSPSGRSGECVSCKNAKNREFKRNNKEKIKKESLEYKIKNKNKIVEYSRKRYLEKKDHITNVNKKWYFENKEKVRENRRKYAKNNRDKFHIKESIRRARKIENTHELFNPKIHNVYYHMRLRLEKCLGIKYHIDHILPLAKGGYHHHLNLQVIPSDLNSEKNDNLYFKHPSLVHWTELPDWLLDRVVLPHPLQQ